MKFSGSNSFNSHNLGNSENGVTPLRQGKSFSLCQAHPHPALCHPRGPCGLRRHVLRADWLRRPRCMENFRPIAVDNGPFMDNLWWFTDENGWFSIANGWSTGKIWFFWASEENEEPSRKCGIHQVGWVERRFLKNWRWTSQKLIVHLIAWPETLKKTGSSFLKPSPKSDSRVFVSRGDIRNKYLHISPWFSSLNFSGIQAAWAQERPVHFFCPSSHLWTLRRRDLPSMNRTIAMSKCGTSFSWPCRCWIFVVSEWEISWKDHISRGTVYCRIAPLPYPKIPKPAFGRGIGGWSRLLASSAATMERCPHRAREAERYWTSHWRFHQHIGQRPVPRSLNKSSYTGYIWLYYLYQFSVALTKPQFSGNIISLWFFTCLTSQWSQVYGLSRISSGCGHFWFLFYQAVAGLFWLNEHAYNVVFWARWYHEELMGISVIFRSWGA